MSKQPKPVALVIGASRGIGRQVAIDLAKNGYAVVVAAKSTSTPTSSLAAPFVPPDPNSPQSTITTVAREIHEAGGEATAIPVDVRDFASIQELVRKTIEKYNHLTALIYNPGAIYWAPVHATSFRRFQLLQRVNVEGLPPIYSRFFRGKTAYAMGKVGMSVLTMGLGMDFAREKGLVEERRVAVCSIWPAVAIESAATAQFTRQNPSSAAADLRKPTIFSDAILAMLRQPNATAINGKLFLDEDYLREHGGVTDFSRYAVVPGSSPRRIMPAVLPDLTVAEQDDEGIRMDSSRRDDASKAKL